MLHCSDALCMKLRNYKGKHDTSFTLFPIICIYNVVIVVVEINFSSIKKKYLRVTFTLVLCQENVTLGNIERNKAVVLQGHCMIVERYPGT